MTVETAAVTVALCSDSGDSSDSSDSGDSSDSRDSRKVCSDSETV